MHQGQRFLMQGFFLERLSHPAGFSTWICMENPPQQALPDQISYSILHLVWIHRSPILRRTVGASAGFAKRFAHHRAASRKPAVAEA